MNNYTDIAHQIDVAYTNYKAAQRSSALNALRIGLLLQQVAEGLPHGEYGKWVAAHCPFSARAAAYYRAAVNNHPDYAELVRVLDAQGVGALNEVQSAQYAELARMPRTLLYLATRADADAETSASASNEKDIQLDAAEIAAGLITMSAPQTTITTQDLRAVTQVLQEALVTGAIDAGDGMSVPLSEALHSAVTQEVYENMRRQQAHIAQARQTPVSTVRLTVDLADVAGTIARLRHTLQALDTTQREVLVSVLRQILS